MRNPLNISPEERILIEEHRRHQEITRNLGIDVNRLRRDRELFDQHQDLLGQTRKAREICEMMDQAHPNR
jgi:hypothetical protein